MEIVDSILKNRTVVIADDDNFMRAILRSVIASSGLRVLGEATDGVRALDMFQRLKPEILCLDIEMPEMSGLEVLAKIREQNAQVIILMITAAATGENVRRAITGRADGIIAKPFNAVKVIGEIERAVERSKAAMEARGE